MIQCGMSDSPCICLSVLNWFAANFLLQRADFAGLLTQAPLAISSFHRSSYSLFFQNVFAQLRERLHPGERHAAHDPDLPQVLWKRGWQIYTEQGWAQRDAYHRARQLPGGMEIYSLEYKMHTQVSWNRSSLHFCFISSQNAQDKEAVDKVMGDLDSNNDGEVDFTEFIILVGALTVACNDFFLEYNDKPEKKKWTCPWDKAVHSTYAPGRKHLRRGRSPAKDILSWTLRAQIHKHTRIHVLMSFQWYMLCVCVSVCNVQSIHYKLYLLLCEKFKSVSAHVEALNMWMYLLFFFFSCVL